VPRCPTSLPPLPLPDLGPALPPKPPALLRDSLDPDGDLKKYGATTVVRVCEVTYDKAPLEKDGITVVDWPFDDGAPPPGKVVDDWLSLLKAKFCDDPGSCVAVHCVAGLGRAPVLVALALLESGMKYEDAVQFIRQKRRGAINSKQLTYLDSCLVAAGQGATLEALGSAPPAPRPDLFSAP
uniref:Protein tyrosine phosphatase type IVA 3 n=1 Tax=Oryctolagus cuniculus TaxID=9986 RepID=A0A5F9D6C9_RABIT